MFTYENIGAILEYPIYILASRLHLKPKDIAYGNIVLGLLTVVYFAHFGAIIYVGLSLGLYGLLLNGIHKLDVILALFMIVFFIYNFTSASCTPAAAILQTIFFRGFSLSVDIIQSSVTMEKSIKLPTIEYYLAYIFSPFGFWNGYFIGYENFTLIMNKPVEKNLNNIWFGLLGIYFIIDFIAKTIRSISLYTYKYYRGPIYVLLALVIIMKKFVMWKITQLAIASSAVYSDPSKKKDELDNAPIQKLRNVMGFNDWYSNFGYSMSYFWVNYVKLPLKIPSFNYLIFIIANVNCKHFRTLLFIPELLLLYHVDRMPAVVKLKSKRSLFYYLKTIGYVQGFYLTVNSLADSYDEFLAIRESTFLIFPILSLVTLGLVQYYAQYNYRNLED